MALTYGFFNSVGGDRVYNADQMSEMFDGLISDGVFQNVGDSMRVVANGGLNINVLTGRARINSQWVKIDAPYEITLNSAHVTLNRYTAICLRVNFAERKIDLIARDGTNATEPEKPTPTRNEYYYDLVLAYIYLKAGATNITQVNIEDTRPNTSLCGIVSSLIQNIDTENLYNQYIAAYNEQLNVMNAWFEAQKTAYCAWFNNLTSKLNVDTTIHTATANYTTSNTNGERYIDIPTVLDYQIGDVLMVYINGVNLAHDIDYTVQLNEVSGGYMIVLPQTVAAGNVFTFTIIKSKIGESVDISQVGIITDNGISEAVVTASDKIEISEV